MSSAGTGLPVIQNERTKGFHTEICPHIKGLAFPTFPGWDYAAAMRDEYNLRLATSSSGVLISVKDVVCTIVHPAGINKPLKTLIFSFIHIKVQKTKPKHKQISFYYAPMSWQNTFYFDIKHKQS